MILSSFLCHLEVILDTFFRSEQILQACCNLHEDPFDIFYYLWLLNAHQHHDEVFPLPIMQ